MSANTDLVYASYASLKKGDVWIYDPLTDTFAFSDRIVERYKLRVDGGPGKRKQNPDYIVYEFDCTYKARRTGTYDTVVMKKGRWIGLPEAFVADYGSHVRYRTEDSPTFMNARPYWKCPAPSNPR